MVFLNAVSCLLSLCVCIELFIFCPLLASSHFICDCVWDRHRIMMLLLMGAEIGQPLVIVKTVKDGGLSIISF